MSSFICGPRNNIARLETDGGLDQTLDLSTVGSYVTATAVQPDGKIRYRL